MKNRMISIREASDMLGVSQWYLRRLPADILPVYKTYGGHRRYNIRDIKRLMGDISNNIRTVDNVIIYARVSSHEQKAKGDLARQKDRLVDYAIKNGYKITSIYEEVGSGMNDSRAKFKEIIKQIATEDIDVILIEHKDRLTRFNYKIFVMFFDAFGVRVKCVEETLPKSFENELVEDILSLMASFSAKIYGKRSHKNKKRNSYETKTSVSSI